MERTSTRTCSLPSVIQQPQSARLTPHSTTSRSCTAISCVICPLRGVGTHDGPACGPRGYPRRRAYSAALGERGCDPLVRVRTGSATGGAADEADCTNGEVRRYLTRRSYAERQAMVLEGQLGGHGSRPSGPPVLLRDP